MKLIESIEDIEVSTEYETIVNPPLKVEVVLEPTFSIPFTYGDLKVDVKFKCCQCNTLIVMEDASNLDLALALFSWKEEKYLEKEFEDFIMQVSEELLHKVTDSYVHLEKKRFQFSSKTYIPNIYYSKCPHCGSQYLMFYKFSGGGQDRCPVTLTIDCIWQVHLDEAFAQKYLTVER